MAYNTLPQRRVVASCFEVLARALGNSLLILIFLWTPQTASIAWAAQAVEQGAVINREYTIKAAFLYHFLGYIEWPSEAPHGAEQPYVIGVFEKDPFNDALYNLAKTKTVGDRAIQVRTLSSVDTANECHIVFVPRTVSADSQIQLLRKIKDSHVLSVGESDNFIDHGGVVQFYLEGNKVRFAFNIDLVESNGLKISSKLLTLAKIITSKASVDKAGGFQR